MLGKTAHLLKAGVDLLGGVQGRGHTPPSPRQLGGGAGGVIFYDKASQGINQD